MRGVCPGCGLVADLEAFLTDADWRAVVDFFPNIPAQLQRRSISFLGLFRGKNALRPSTALKILRGLQELATSGSVKWEGCETRPAPVELWIEAIDAMIESGKRGFTDRQGLNYLRHTAWVKAEGLARKTESRREIERRHRVEDPVDSPPATEEERKAVKDMMKQFLGKS